MNIKQVSTLPAIESAVVGVDIETTRKFKKHKKDPSDPRRDRIVSLQVSDGETVWILTDNYQSAVPVLTNPDIKKVGQNFAFDIAFLNHQLGVQVENIHDTLIAERTLHAGEPMSHALDDILARRYGVYTDKSIRDQFESHTGKLTDEQLEYAAIDAFYLPKLREDQVAEISRAGMGRVMAVENKIVPVVAQMFLNGIGFDRDLWEKYLVDIERKLVEIASESTKHVALPSSQPLFGSPAVGLDLGSTQQIQNYLNDTYSLDLESADEEALLMVMAAATEEAQALIQDVLAWREWDKRRSWAYHQFVHPITGRIHASWKSSEARTGRVACERPNLMQTPRWTGGEDEPNLRLLFIPTAQDRVFIVADYSQQEPRIFAQISGDPAMRRACNSKDVYLEFGKDIYGYEIKKGSEERQSTKTGVLARLYGGQPKKLAHALGTSLERAEIFARQVDQAYPVAKGWTDCQLSQLIMRGYTTTLLGRKRYFPEAKNAPQALMNKLRNRAVNTPMQGSGADMFKLATAKLVDVIKENRYDAFPALFVHDELVVECHKSIAEEVYYQVIGCMEEAGRELCPDVETIAEGKISERWVKA